MGKTVIRGLLAAGLFSAAMAMPTHAWAGDWPFTQGDYWDITGVHLKDGGAFAYAKFLASQWKADQEFAKSKGWIKGYAVMSNVNPRKGESDIYLVVIYERQPSGPESDKRNDEYLAWKKTTDAQLVKEGGDRAEIREIQDSFVLQELKFK